jgi:ectoine hydroxylase-related dioxygenase (phytanoyl-CoA dioxygenase family)
MQVMMSAQTEADMQHETLRRDGVVVLPGVFDPGWIDLLRGAMDQMLQGAYDPVARAGADDAGPKVLSRDGMWRNVEAFSRFLFQSPIGDLAARLLQSREVRLYEDLLLFNGAGAVATSRWHRDSPWWPLRGDQLVTIWLSLEPVTAETGAMRFVTGSQRDPDEVALAAMVADEVATADADRVVVIETQPGDAVAFHPRILHTAYGSAVEHPRRTFTIRFMGDDIRWRPRREMYHEWMRDCGLAKGDVLDHPWFPVVGRHAVDS